MRSKVVGTPGFVELAKSPYGKFGVSLWSAVYLFYCRLSYDFMLTDMCKHVRSSILKCEVVFAKIIL